MTSVPGLPVTALVWFSLGACGAVTGPSHLLDTRRGSSARL